MVDCEVSHMKTRPSAIIIMMSGCAILGCKKDSNTTTFSELECSGYADQAVCDVERAVSLCNDIAVRLPALSLELKKKETRRRNIGSAVTIGIGAAGAVITAAIASTQTSDGMTVENKNATIVSAGITGAASVAAAVTTVVVGNGFSDQIDLIRLTIENIGAESARFMKLCDIGASPLHTSCRSEARRYREFCISSADAAQLAMRPRHAPKENAK